MFFIDSTAVAGAVGGLTVSGSVSVYNFGSSMSAEDAALLNVKDENGNAQSFDAFVADYINQSNTGTALTNYEGNTVAAGIKGDVDKRNFTANVTTGSTAGELGTVAKLGSGSVINASSINVNAQGNTYTDTNVGTGSAGAVAAGASVGVVHNDGVVNAIVDNTAKITATNTFDINAKAVSDLNGLAAAPAVGIIAGSAASLDLNSATEVVTNIGNNVVLSANAINITAETTPKINAYATGVGVGIAGVGAVVALADSADTAAVVLGSDTSLSSTGDVNIAAKNSAPADGYTAYVKAEAGSGGVLAGSVTVSQIDLTNEATVTIGGGGRIDAKAVTIEAKHQDAINYENLSAGAAGVSGTGSDSRLNVNSNVGISIADSSTATDDKQQIITKQDVTIKAENETIKDWLNATDDNAVGEDDYNSLSAGASLVGGSGIVNRTDIVHNTKIDIADAVIKANASALTEDEQAAGKTLADKNAITIDAHSNIVSKDYQYIGAGAAVEAMHISDANNAVANTEITMASDVELEAGDIAKTKVTVTDTKLTSGNYSAGDVGGGSIAIGTRNNADLYSKTVVNAWGASGYTGTDNNVSYTGNSDTTVNASLQTANGDIIMGAGVDADGNKNSLNATANSLMLNNTVIPISVTPDPQTLVNTASKLTLGSDAVVLSDRDVYLKASGGIIDALGYGEIKDWAHDLGDSVGADCSITGDAKKVTSADVEVNGSVETGTNRKQSITIGGSHSTETKDGVVTGGVWDTSIERTYGVGYKFTKDTNVSSTLEVRLEELYDLRAKYVADSAAVAAYDAEIEFIQAKMVENGLAYYAVDTQGNSVFVQYNHNATTNGSNSSLALKTNEVELDDLTVRLGNIVVEGDNFYGTGNLNAASDAEVKVINNSPNNLVVNDIIIHSDGAGIVNTVYDGGYITFNNISVGNADDVNVVNYNKKASFAQVSSKANADSVMPVVKVESNFVPAAYPVKTSNTNAYETEKYFAAPSLTISQGALIYNPKGEVNISSVSGDILSSGTINAGSVSVKAKNGDYVQGYTDRIVSVGGDPEDVYQNGNEVYGSDAGILANGNIYISARYININSGIQSGVDYWDTLIPEAPTFYKDGDTSQTFTVAQINADADSVNHRFTLANGTHTTFANGISESIAENITYDAATKRLVVDGIETNGGRIELVGTILSTRHNSSDGANITVLDGNSKFQIENNSGLDLELRNISTGTGVEGVITITDLDYSTGKVTRKTTYTRVNNLITTKVETFDASGNSTGETTSTVNGSKTKYQTAADMYYVWQEGVDSSTIKEYYYHDSQFVPWWEDGEHNDTQPTDVQEISNITGTSHPITPNGTFIANSSVPNPGNGVEVSETSASGEQDYYREYEYTITTNQERYDERTETTRLWYTLGLVEEYDHWYKEKTGTTKITQHSIAASQPVAIKFVGREDGGDVDVTSNADIFLNGVLQNSTGSTDITATNIWQAENGLIRTNELSMTAENDIGTNTNSVKLDASSLMAINAKNGSVYVDDVADNINVGRVVAENVVSIAANGNIFYEDYNPLLINVYSNIKADRIELTSRAGSITDIILSTGQGEGADYGLKASALKDINIVNRNGDLYIDSVVSQTGDVTLNTNGNFIDNNFTDVVEDDVQEKIAIWSKAQVLEKDSNTVSFQIRQLSDAAQGKYNRYQALKARVVDGKFVLSDVDKDALSKLGYSDEQISNYVAKCQAEYESLKAFGADGWSAETLQSYKEQLGGSNSSEKSFYANAALSADDLSADTFLTVEEKAQVLVGSARTAGELVVNIASLKDDVIDTTVTKKTVPNVQGNDVTLIVRDGEHSIGSSETITTTVDNIQALLNKEYDAQTTLSADEQKLLEALVGAEQKDIIIDDNGNVTINHVKALTVNADGTLKVKAGLTDNKDNAVANVFVNSDNVISFETITANGDVRLKSDAGIDGTTINNAGDIVLEASGGAIGNNTASGLEALQLGDSSKVLTARAKGDINITKDGDLEVSSIYSADGEINLNGATDVVVNKAISNNININALGNVELYNASIKGLARLTSGLDTEVCGVDFYDLIVNAKGSVTLKDLFISNQFRVKFGTGLFLDYVEHNGIKAYSELISTAGHKLLYASEYAGKDTEEDEREDSEKHHTEIVFSEVAHHEDYEDL